MTLGDVPIDVYVLDTGVRVISMRAVLKVLAGVDGGALEDYIGVRALKPFIDSNLVLEESVYSLVAVRWIGSVNELDRRRSNGGQVPVRLWPFSPQARVIILGLTVVTAVCQLFFPVPGLRGVLDNVSNVAFPLGLYLIACGDLPPRRRAEKRVWDSRRIEA